MVMYATLVVFQRDLDSIVMLVGQVKVSAFEYVDLLLLLVFQEI